MVDLALILHLPHSCVCVCVCVCGSIPFMGMLGTLYPQAQFIITGVLGPASNAHGSVTGIHFATHSIPSADIRYCSPNEFLHIEFGKKITSCVSLILAAHATSA